MVRAQVSALKASHGVLNGVMIDSRNDHEAIHTLFVDMSPHSCTTFDHIQTDLTVRLIPQVLARMRDQLLMSLPMLMLWNLLMQVSTTMCII